jgi:histidinol dehydrogenase
MKREEAPDVDAAVAAIIADVRARGDAAVIDLTARFDRLDLTPAGWRSPRPRSTPPVRAVPRDDRAALELAAARIRAYHAASAPRTRAGPTMPGATLGWRWGPVQAAGLYVPGGLASYPSSVLMNAIPAKVAGVPRLVIACPTPGGVVNPLVLLACAAGRGGDRLPHRRRAGDRGAGLWHREHRARWTRSPGPATPLSRRPSGGCSARSAST